MFFVYLAVTWHYKYIHLSQLLNCNSVHYTFTTPFQYEFLWFHCCWLIFLHTSHALYDWICLDIFSLDVLIPKHITSMAFPCFLPCFLPCLLEKHLQIRQPKNKRQTNRTNPSGSTSEVQVSGFFFCVEALPGCAFGEGFPRDSITFLNDDWGV